MLVPRDAKESEPQWLVRHNAEGVVFGGGKIKSFNRWQLIRSRDRQMKNIQTKKGGENILRLHTTNGSFAVFVRAAKIGNVKKYSLSLLHIYSK